MAGSGVNAERVQWDQGESRRVVAARNDGVREGLAGDRRQASGRRGSRRDAAAPTCKAPAHRSAAFDPQHSLTLELLTRVHPN